MSAVHRRRSIAVLATALLGLQLLTALPAHAVDFQAGNATETEPSGLLGLTTMRFEITRASTASADAVDYETVDGTATAGRDYVGANGSVFFEPGEASREVRIDILGDTLDEATETFELKLSKGGNPQGSAIGTIEDDADAPPSVSISDAFADEGNPASFLVTLSAPSGREITVDFATANGTATAGADYTAANGPRLTFSPGEISEEVIVPVAGDALDEADETFTVGLSVPAGSPVGLGDGSGAAIIFDDDGLPSISIADAAGTEGVPGAKASFKVSLSAPSGRTVEATATALNGPLGGTGATSGSDFEATNRTVTIPAGQTEVFVDIPILNDSIHESTETFAVVLNGPSNAMAGDMSATGTITDDDAGPVLAISDVTDTEAPLALLVPRTFSFTVTLTGATATPTTVSYATADGSAKAGSDYSTASGVVTFPAGPGPQTRPVVVTITNDVLAEADETFTVNLSNPSGGASLGDATGVGTILNDDGAPTVIAVDDAPAMTEGGDAVFTVRRLTAPTGQAATVSYATRDGSAKAGKDYTARTGFLTFGPGETAAKTITVELTDDPFDEEDTETLGLDLSDPLNAIFENGDASAAGSITDNDAAPTFIVDAVTVPEGDSGSSTRTVEVRLSAPSGREVKVNFATMAGTATSPADYSGAPATGTLTFAPGDTLPGETVKLVRVNVVGDVLDEDDENLRIKLSNPVNGTVPGALSSPGAEFKITDDDATPTVRIDNANLDEPGDDSGNREDMRFVVRLSAVSGRNVTVDAATGAPATAGGSDYSSQSDPVSILAGAASGTFSVPIKGDSADEDDETFTVTLSAPVNATIVAPGTATGTIVDDDGPATLRIDPVTVGESIGGGKATVTVRLFPTSTTPVTVNWATEAASATAPGDFTAASGQLTFAAGDSSETLQVTIAPDGTDEADEKFKVNLSSPNPASTAMSPAEAEVTITDDDGPTVSAAGFNVSEGNSGTKMAEFTVALSAASPQTVTVGYATVSGSAVSPADFTAVNGGLTFGPGETSKKVPVPVVGDTTDEADEDFSLTFFNPTNATAGAPAKAVIIDDDQPNVTVTGSGASGGLGATDPVVTEGDKGTTPMSFAIGLDATTTRDVTVSWAVGTGGTAFPGPDYAPIAGRITFAPGETVKTVVVAVRGDALDEVDETVTLRLLAPVNGTITDAEALGTIVDDDKPGYAFVATDGGMFTFGDADFVGSTGDKVLNKPIVGMAAHPSGRGYWLVAEDGGIFSFGEAPFRGSTGDKVLNKPIVGMAAHPSGEGYWLVASDGGIFTFGAADFHGSTGDKVLNKPIVGMAAHPSGNGYWLVASDGGVFAFNAPFKGSTGDKVLNKPIVGMAAHPSGDGYWLAASDGGVFSFNAPFLGSTGDEILNKPVKGMGTL